MARNRPEYRVTKTDGETGRKSTIARTESGDKAQQRRLQEVERNRSQRRGWSDSISVHKIQHRK